jgi:hypothetical protein
MGGSVNGAMSKWVVLIHSTTHLLPYLKIKKAARLIEVGEETGVFVWAPRLRHWLKDPNYIFWLGTVRMA